MIEQCQATKYLIREYNLEYKGKDTEAVPPIVLAQSPRDNKKCECGSNKKYRRCCKNKK